MFANLFSFSTFYVFTDWTFDYVTIQMWCNGRNCASKATLLHHWTEQLA